MKKHILLISLIIFVVSIAFYAHAGNQDVSSTLASTIITNARYYLNEPSTTFLSDAEMLVFVNNGTMDIVARSKCLEGTEDISLIANTIEYAITGPYISVTRVVYNDVPRGTKKELEQTQKIVGRTREQEPSFWYEWEGKVGIYPVPVNITDANLAIGSTKTNVATEAITYYINGDAYTASAVAAGTAPGDDVIPATKYGAVALDIGGDGTIDASEAYGNATGFTSAALAASALPPVADGHFRLGYVTASKSDGAFTFGTTDLDAANTTVAYTDAVPTVTVYFIDLPSAVASNANVLVPAQYDQALTYYVAAQGFIKDKNFNAANNMIKLYQSEIDRYRLDLTGINEQPVQ
jgi:hypothetical protein